MVVFFLLSPSFPIGQSVCGAALKKNLSCSLVEGAILEQKKAYFHWWRASFSSLSNSYSNKFFFQSKQPSPLSLFVCSSLLRSEWALIYFASLLIFAKNEEAIWDIVEVSRGTWKMTTVVTVGQSLNHNRDRLLYDTWLSRWDNPKTFWLRSKDSK